MKWTDWKSITNLSDVPSEPGLYKICLKKNGKPYPTQRILNDDKEGIIYIGKHQKSLKLRLTKFLSALDKGTGHIAADRLHDWREDKKINFVNGDIKYAFKILPTNKVPTDEEKNELINYESKYGQFPPLNRKNPGASPRCCKK